METLTRTEQYLSAIAGESDLPQNMKPITREEYYLQAILDKGTGGGGGSSSEEMMEIWLEATTATKSGGTSVTVAQFDTKGSSSYNLSDGFKIKVHVDNNGYLLEGVCDGYCINTDRSGEFFCVPVGDFGTINLLYDHGTGAVTSATILETDRISLTVFDGTFESEAIKLPQYAGYSLSGLVNDAIVSIAGSAKNFARGYESPLIAFFGVDLNNYLIINTSENEYTVGAEGDLIGYIINWLHNVGGGALV